LTNFRDRKKIGVFLFNPFKGFKRKMQGGRGVSVLNPSVEGAKGGSTMAKQIHWETSLTTTKTKAKKEGKLILLDFYNSL
jgi:hypothetical protein